MLKLKKLCAKTDEKHRNGTEKILFSIIIPTLNEEKHIESCLKSIIRQSNKNFEVLVMDGGSRDHTAEIVKKYGFHFINVPKKRPHDVSGARNEGIRMSKGAYLFFLDADMLIEPNTLEVFKQEFIDKDVIGVCLKVLPYNGGSLERSMYEFNNALALIANWTRIYQLSYFSCHCYKREYVQHVKGFRNDLLSCEDMDLSLRLSKMGRFAVSHKAKMYASPRRIRQWSRVGYVARYLKFLIQYYFLNKINDFYNDMTDTEIDSVK